MRLERETLVGPSCWVCGVRFKSSTPPGPAHREDHHIWPQNAGGTEGPLVSLCEPHHSGAHKIALKLHAKQSYAKLMHGESKTAMQKLLFLALNIVKFELATKDDPNKLLRNSVQLTPAETQMMERLQSSTGKSRSDLFRAGLQLLYKQVFKL